MKLELKTFTAKLRFLHRPKRFCLCYLPVGTFGRLGKFWVSIINDDCFIVALETINQ